MSMRLDKLLAEMTEGSRSEVKQWIRKGQVSVDGAVVKYPETKIDPEQQRVTLHGEWVPYRRYEYYMLHKPRGVVSATRDPEYPTVLSLLTTSRRTDLFPVGRLDLDTEGLLLITNDGALAHRLLSPRYHVDKTYFVCVRGSLTENDVSMLEHGMDIGDAKKTLPAVLEQNPQLPLDEMAAEEQKNDLQKEQKTGLLKGEAPSITEREDSYTKVYITIREGRYHQVKRMFASLGKPVVYLKRVRMGNLLLDETLAPGEYRELTQEEIKGLYAENTVTEQRS